MKPRRKRPYGSGSLFLRGRIWHIQYREVKRLPNGQIGYIRHRLSTHSEDKRKAERLLYLKLRNRAKWPLSSVNRNLGKPTQLYFIRNAENGLIKIGISCRAQKRFSNLQNAAGVKLELLKSSNFKNRALAKTEEDRLHQKYASQRALGEWFKPSDELLAEVERAAR